MRKHLSFFFVLMAVAGFFAVGCGSASGTDNPYVELPYNVALSDIQVDVSSALQERNGKNYKKIVFSYPTRNVAGESVRASAIIVMPAEYYNAEPKPEFDFAVLMNHGATTAKKNVPSHGGNLADFEKLIADKKAVGVAADYIGFESSGQIQAFAFGDVNARTSLQALICARKWLSSLGYSWKDKLANVGYSQGGQTAMHVQKLVDTTSVYGSINITKTFAGAGPYDISTTVNKSLSDYNPALAPWVVWLGLISYNRLLKMGFDENSIFKNKADIESKVLDLDYDGGVSPAAWSDSLKPDMLNESSALRKSISKKIAGYNCNFTPKPSSKILMFSDSNDDVVPTKNSDDLFDCFNARGFAMLKKEADTDFSEDNVYIRFETGTFGQGTHGTGSDEFMNKLAAELANWRN
jgi:dienelactone hydrolase